MLFVEAYKNRFKLPEDSIIIDTTSRSGSWTRGFSPFLLQAGHLYGNYYAKSVENAYQASKCYPQFVDENGNPTPEYFKWAQKIWSSSEVYRYPMGRGTKPLFSYWNGEKLNYVEARKKIYIPLYSRAVLKSNAFKSLLKIYRETDKDIYLVDFDGYNHKERGMSLSEVANNTKKSMGHAFVIYDLLQRYKNTTDF
jgi:hypothetical protein